MIDCTKCEHYINKGNYAECDLGGKLYVERPLDYSAYVEKKKTEGKKYDTGKNRVGLMCQGFSKALWGVAEVSTFGANKYGANNWQYLDNPKERYLDALCRHLFQHLQGEKTDKESGLLHLQHCAWNCLALLEFELKESRNNDVD